MNKLNVFLAAIAFSLGFSSCETSKTYRTSVFTC